MAEFPEKPLNIQLNQHNRQQLDNTVVMDEWLLIADVAIVKKKKGCSSKSAYQPIKKAIKDFTLGSLVFNEILMESKVFYKHGFLCRLKVPHYTNFQVFMFHPGLQWSGLA